jgi:UDP-glucuronate decarboxylase
MGARSPLDQLERESTGRSYIRALTSGPPSVRSPTAAMNSVLEQDYVALASRLGNLCARFEGQHVLMTGAAGFIGQYLAGFFAYLNRHVLQQPLTADLLDSFIVGGRPREDDRAPMTARYADVSKRIDTTKSPDYVIHAAGIASPRVYARFPIKTLECGIAGTRRVLRLARKVRSRSLVYFSSSEIYGDPDPSQLPTPETYNGNVSTSGPRACYDESKRIGETWSFLYARTYGLPVKIVRPFNVYGPGFRPGDGRVIPAFIERGMRQQPLIVHGGGANTRTFCYIADFVDALIRLLCSEHNGEAFNVGADGPELSMRDLATIVGGLLPGGASIAYEAPQLAPYACNNPARRCPDISKLLSHTTFRPAYTLRDGLRQTIAWYSEAYGIRDSVEPRGLQIV